MGWLTDIFGKRSASRADVNMKDIVEGLLAGTYKQSKPFGDIVATMQKWGEGVISQAREELLALEQQIEASPEPLRLLRSEIMKLVDAAATNSALLHLDSDKLEAIGKRDDSFSKASLVMVYVCSEFETVCLREYGLRKFKDGRKKDWFSVYRTAAIQSGKHMADVLCAQVGKFEGNPDLVVQVHSAFEATMEELRSRLLASPVGAIFPD